MNYNENNKALKHELDYDNLPHVEQLQIDLTFAISELSILEKRHAKLEQKIEKAKEMLEPFIESNGIALIVFKQLNN
jgi:hypothetical protein